MQNYWLSLSTILPLFLAALAGLLFSRTKSFKKEWIDVLNDYALWIGFPALILVALFKLDVPLAEYIDLAAWNSAYIVLCMLLAFPVAKLFRLSTDTLRTLILAFSFGNVSYLGIPVLMNVYGSGILAESTLLSAVYLFWLFTLGIILVEVLGEHDVNPLVVVKNLLQNPLLIAVLLGLLVSILKFEVPEILVKGLDLFATSVTAVVLFSLGLFLGTHPFGKLKEWLPVAGFSIAILLLLPLVFYGVVLSFGVSFDVRSSILEGAMPMGLTPYVLSVKYKLNATFASKVVVLSTILSVLTLPLWIQILG
ncbi:AEC family transporter [uncultured Sunxiuqinia sp.]|uniref:AEC family transporter n=1 Tax=uncultured Sunxiuqinia sp. TaxID=1573825 RepID=UPI0030D7000E|tara:strand:+ start:102761 stop:103687 length:927 start_codon:yes stop_codon:yes gene_type:complete